jgi:hypothetical protein
MKKIFLICIAIFAVLSCSNNEAVDSGAILSEKPDLMKIDNVLKMTNSTAQKTAYSLLNESEKFKIWNDKIELALQNNKFNSLQKELILDIQKNLKVKDFSDGDNDHKAYFKDIFLKNHLVKLKSSFSVNNIITLFYSISNPSTINNTSKILIITGGKNCNCNRGSMITCNAGSGCNTGPCTASTTGCGMFWGWECNGVCDLTNFKKG